MFSLFIYLFNCLIIYLFIYLFVSYMNTDLYDFVKPFFVLKRELMVHKERLQLIYIKS